VTENILQSNPDERIAVSVIIPVLNDAPRLSACLAALENQGFELPFEILVVDNGSSDDPASVLQRFPAARLLREQQRSSYAARNTGVRHARGEVFAFTDSDCIPAEHWLERGYESVRGLDQPAFVAGRIDVFPKDLSAPTLAERYDRLHGFPQLQFTQEFHFGATANLFVHRDVFDKVGDFADDLISSGDREWGQRAGARGVDAIYADRVTIRHPARSFDELLGKAKRLQLGFSQLRRMRGESLPLATLLRPIVRPPVRLIARNVSEVEPPTLRSKVSYVGFALLMSYVGAVEQARVACRERAGALS
jgi:glycosyltransferase involved in cell wall biosynthesis